jgi:glycosyltransferase involved in cell wall biosynthesis
MHSLHEALDPTELMPTDTPDIAVVIPALNAAAHLRSALSSLAAQDGDFEAVLVDGGSRDDTVAIAAQAGVRVIPAPGTSIYEAHNRGFAETRAPAIVLLNADDVLLPGALAAWRDALAKAPAAGIVRGRATFSEFDRTGVAAPVEGADERAAAPLDTDLLLRGPCAINSLCIRRTVFDRIGAFDTAYRLAADREWMLRAWIAEVPMVEIEQAVYRYLMHDGSSTIDRARKNFALVRRENITIAQRYMSGAPARQASPETLRAVRQWHAAETTMLASHHLRSGDVRNLIDTTQRSLRAAPLWPLRGAQEVAAWLWKKAR